MKQKNDNTSFWDELRGVIHSRIGGLVIGEDVYSHGYSILHDLLGKASYFQVYLLNITGRLPHKSVAHWVEAFFILVSYPDARIWCNQIGSLAGSLSSSPVSAVSAGILASDSKLYGPGVVRATTELLLNSLREKEAGSTYEEIVNNLFKNNRFSGAGNMSGFSRPVARGDERVAILDEYATILGFKRGKFQNIAFKISELLFASKKESVNFAGYSIAFLLDQSFSPDEIYKLCSPIVQSGVLACHTDSADAPGESFFPLQCNDIDYKGVPERTVPDNEVN